jgi:hypothetical protein
VVRPQGDNLGCNPQRRRADYEFLVEQWPGVPVSPQDPPIAAVLTNRKSVGLWLW